MFALYEDIHSLGIMWYLVSSELNSSLLLHIKSVETCKKQTSLNVFGGRCAVVSVRKRQSSQGELWCLVVNSLTC